MLDLARRIVEEARKRGADETEVFISRDEATGFSIERNVISSISGGMERGMGIRVIKDKKLGFSYCTEERKAGEAIDQALAISKLGRESGFTFPEPAGPREVKNTFDNRIIEYSAEKALGDATQMIVTALEADPDIIVSRGGVGYGQRSFAVANSKGLAVEDSGTHIGAGIFVVLKRNGMSTGYEDISSRTYDIDYGAIGREGAQLALRGQNAKKVETKGMTVVFTPDAFANLVEFITAPALYGEAVHKGESVYSDKLGERVASEGLTLIDDGALAGGLNTASVDDEGVVSGATELISKGTLSGFLFSQGSAIEYDTNSTGNAMRTERLSSSRSYRSPPVVKARNLVVSGETSKLDQLIGDVREGVLVHDILGAHTSNPVSGDFSVNSSMLFKIDSGEVTYPIKSAMLGGNFPEVLKNVNGIGDDYKLVAGGLTPISFSIPSISLEGIRVTG